jgi:tRNA C32,U32 (ribose-2'-O)-methylase TrmJ
MTVTPYTSAIGSIIYTMLCMLPDVSYALSAMRRYQSNYGEAHWTILKNIVSYLRRTKEVFIVFGGEFKKSSL